MARLLTLLAPRLARGGPVYDRVNVWTGDLTAAGDAVALRVASGLHRLVLGRQDADLAATYPPNVALDAELIATAEAAFARHQHFFDRWLDSPPQTNEVRRSAALIAAAHWLADRHPLPLRLSELGASAGLNLGFDHIAMEAGHRRLGKADSPLLLTPKLTGRPLPDAPFSVAERRGVDLRPVDLADPDDRLRLTSYIWPDQTHRLHLTKTAIANARDLGVTVDAGGAQDWLAHRLAAPEPGLLHLVFHTVAWQYFPPATARRCRALIEKAGQAATPQAPLAWFGMEADGGEGAALTLRLWPGDLHFHLGRASFHGLWLNWDPQPV